MSEWQGCDCGGGAHPIIAIHYPSCGALKQAADVTRLPVNVYRALRARGVPPSDLWMAAVPETDWQAAPRLRQLGRPAWETLLKASGVWYLAPKHLIPDDLLQLFRSVFVTERDEATLRLLDLDSTLEAGIAGTPLQAMDFWATTATSLTRLSPTNKQRLGDTQHWVRCHYGATFTSSQLTF